MNSLRIGDKIKAGKRIYSVESHLGTGAVGEVYQVISENNKRYALKMLIPGSDQDLQTKFNEEPHILSKFERYPSENLHQRVPRVIDQGRHRVLFKDKHIEQPFFIMTLAHGTNLDELMFKQRHSPLQEQEGLIIACQCLEVLHVLHEKIGAAYTDMKLENFYWNEKQLFIIDWNIVDYQPTPSGKQQDFRRLGAFLNYLLTQQRITFTENNNTKSVDISYKNSPKFQNLTIHTKSTIKALLNLNKNSATIKNPALNFISKIKEAIKLIRNTHNDYKLILNKIPTLIENDQRETALIYLDVLNKHGQHLMSLDDLKTVNAWKKSIQHRTNPTANLLKLALQKLQENEIERAKSFLTEAYKRTPGDLETNLWLLGVHFWNNKVTCDKKLKATVGLLRDAISHVLSQNFSQSISLLKDIELKSEYRPLLAKINYLRSLSIIENHIEQGRLDWAESACQSLPEVPLSINADYVISISEDVIQLDARVRTLKENLQLCNRAIETCNFQEAIKACVAISSDSHFGPNAVDLFMKIQAGLKIEKHIEQSKIKAALERLNTNQFPTSTRKLLEQEIVQLACNHFIEETNVHLFTSDNFSLLNKIISTYSFGKLSIDLKNHVSKKASDLSIKQANAMVTGVLANPTREELSKTREALDYLKFLPLQERTNHLRQIDEWIVAIDVLHKTVPSEIKYDQYQNLYKAISADIFKHSDYQRDKIQEIREHLQKITSDANRNIAQSLDDLKSKIFALTEWADVKPELENTLYLCQDQWRGFPEHIKEPIKKLERTLTTFLSMQQIPTEVTSEVLEKAIMTLRSIDEFIPKNHPLILKYQSDLELAYLAFLKKSLNPQQLENECHQTIDHFRTGEKMITTPGARNHFASLINQLDSLNRTNDLIHSVQKMELSNEQSPSTELLHLYKKQEASIQKILSMEYQSPRFRILKKQLAEHLKNKFDLIFSNGLNTTITLKISNLRELENEFTESLRPYQKTWIKNLSIIKQSKSFRDFLNQVIEILPPPTPQRIDWFQIFKVSQQCSAENRSLDHTKVGTSLSSAINTTGKGYDYINKWTNKYLNTELELSIIEQTTDLYHFSRTSTEECPTLFNHPLTGPFLHHFSHTIAGYIEHVTKLSEIPTDQERLFESYAHIQAATVFTTIISNKNPYFSIATSNILKLIKEDIEKKVTLLIQKHRDLANREIAQFDDFISRGQYANICINKNKLESILQSFKTLNNPKSEKPYKEFSKKFSTSQEKLKQLEHKALALQQKRKEIFLNLSSKKSSTNDVTSAQLKCYLTEKASHALEQFNKNMKEGKSTEQNYFESIKNYGWFEEIENKRKPNPDLHQDSLHHLKACFKDSSMMISSHLQRSFKNKSQFEKRKIINIFIEDHLKNNSSAPKHYINLINFLLKLKNEGITNTISSNKSQERSAYERPSFSFLEKVSNFLKGI